MKTRNLLLVGLLMASMVLTACQQKPGNVPADPVAAVKIIADKQKEITTEHLDVTLTLGIQATGIKTDPSNPSAASAAAFLKNFKANVAVNGDLDTVKNEVNLTGSADIGALTALLAQGADKITFDLIKVGDKLYTRSSVTGADWNESAAGSSTTTPGSSPTVTATQAMDQLAEVLKRAAKAEKLADENINGTNTYHYKVTLDAIALIDQAVAVAQANASATSTPPDPKQIQQAKDLLTGSVLELDMWVGQEDLYVRQEWFHVNLNLKNIPDNPGATVLVDLLLKIGISNINKPVTIVAPK